MSEPTVTPPLPRVSFENVLPLNLLLTLALLPAADRFIGLAGWLREARAVLPAGLLQEIALLTGFPGGHLRFVEVVAERTVPDDGPTASSFAAWLASLEAHPADEFQAMALQALRRGLSPETVSDADLLEPHYLRAYLAAWDPERDHSAAVALVVDPAQLKARLLQALVQFWDLLYEAAYARCRPLLECSVAHHRLQPPAGDLAGLFQAVTGRTIPGAVQISLPHLRRVRFAPSCHLGPHVAFFRQEGGLTIFYSVPGPARPTGTSGV